MEFRSILGIQLECKISDWEPEVKCFALITWTMPYHLHNANDNDEDEDDEDDDETLRIKRRSTVKKKVCIRIIESIF